MNAAEAVSSNEVVEIAEEENTLLIEDLALPEIREQANAMSCD